MKFRDHRILCPLVAGLMTGASLTVFPSSARAQSFDCRKATTAVEKMVCDDMDLGMLDEHMARAFADARQKVAVNAIGQVAWLRAVRNRCASVDCLKGAYQKRIAHLRSLNAAVLSSERLAGKWTRPGRTHHDSAELTIADVTPTGFAFELTAMSGVHHGQIDGDAVRRGTEAVFRDAESKCEVRFSPGSDYLFLSTSNECIWMGGMGVTFHGEFEKGRIDTRPTLAGLGILAPKVTEDAFAAVVGADYGQFVQSFHMFGELEDLDGLGTRVVAGAVRGLMNQMEAIVMSRSDGTIYAAVLEEIEIRYVSNDPKFKQKLPVTIEKWVKSLGDKELVFQK